ncbi:MAG: hypothetical protein ACJ8G2_10790 [Burkholderiales bacterium]
MSKPWHQAARDGSVSGAAASIASALVLLACGAREQRRASAPLNAVSHWIWNEAAVRQNRPSLRFTLLGYVIHHGAAVFWASLYEKFLARPDDSAARTLQKTALSSAVACIVDFKFTPRRFTPGYERRLSKQSLFLVYSAFAIGMAGAGLLKDRKRDR